jgi:hypothetical protein
MIGDIVNGTPMLEGGSSGGNVKAQRLNSRAGRFMLPSLIL